MATDLQQKATAKIVELTEKHRKVSVSKIMREVGYDPTTASKPSQLTESKGYKELLGKYNLTDDRYYKKIDDALEAKKWNDFTGEREPDYKTQLPYHTKLGKLLGVEKEQPQTNILVQPIIGGLTSVPLDERNKETPQLEKENQSNSGGDLSQQDDLDTLIAD